MTTGIKYIPGKDALERLAHLAERHKFNRQIDYDRLERDDSFAPLPVTTLFPITLAIPHQDHMRVEFQWGGRRDQFLFLDMTIENYNSLPEQAVMEIEGPIHAKD